MLPFTSDSGANALFRFLAYAGASLGYQTIPLLSLRLGNLRGWFRFGEEWQPENRAMLEGYFADRINGFRLTNRLSATKRAATHQNYILCEKGLIEAFDDALGKTQIGKQRQGSSIRPSVKFSQISPQSPSAQGEHAQLIGWDAWVHIPDQCYVASCTMQRKALERKT